MSYRHQLLALAKQDTADSRNSLAQNMLWMLDRPVLADMEQGERDAVLQILSTIIEDTEREIRAAIADNIKDLPDAPRNLVTFLAQDEALIAAPVIEHSPVLQDEDLLALVRITSLDHLMAMAKRQDLAEVISDALVETGDAGVVSALLENQSAHIAATTYDWLVDESRAHARYRTLLVRRKDLPHDAATRLYQWVDWTMRQELQKRFQLNTGQMDRLLDRSRSLLAGQEAAGYGTWSAAARILSQMTHHNVLSNNMMLSVLEAGHLTLFLAHVMKKTGLRRMALHRALFLNSPEALVAVGRIMEMHDSEIMRLEEFMAKLACFGAPGHGHSLRFAEALDNVDKERAGLAVQTWKKDGGWMAGLQFLQCQ